jgi:curved DNA-binding protein CbpA
MLLHRTVQIKKKYKQLALRYHPDRNHGQEEQATQLFKELSAAYSVLSDPNERQWYDDHRDGMSRLLSRSAISLLINVVPFSMHVSYIARGRRYA